jgi:flagellar basal-body rod modification protein FlgD
VVGTSNLGARSAGRHSFEVDTSAYSGTGALSFRITALRAGQPISATPLERARVDGVSMDNKALSLQLNGRAAVPYTEVRAVL